MIIDTGVPMLAAGLANSGAERPKLLMREKLGTTHTSQDEQVKKAGKDFESMLLGSWLQKAEQSFGSVPGGDGQDDEDSGKDQFQGIAMQALAGSLTNAGGIGLGKIITAHLLSASRREAGERSTEKP